MALLKTDIQGMSLSVFDYLRSELDHARGRPKTAFPTRYHYVEILRDALVRVNIRISRLGQHCLILNDTATGRELVVVVRYVTESDLARVEARKRRGARIAFLIDDDYWAMLEDDLLSPAYRARLVHFLERYFSRLLPMLDVAVAPSMQILSRLPDLPGVHMQPATLPVSADLCHFDTPDCIRMVFLGTGTHCADFAVVAPGVARALQDNPRLHLTTLLGKKGGELLPAGHQVRHMGSLFFPWFQKWLARQRFHIALAPYEPNPVNNGRSNLKVQQHALVGAAGLYTHTGPFLQAVEDGKSGRLLDYDAGHWEQEIGRLAADLESARALAGGGAAAVESGCNHEKLAQSWAELL